MGKSQSGMINMNDDSTDDGLAHTVKIKGVQPSYFKGLGVKTGCLVQNTLHWSWVMESKHFCTVGGSNVRQQGLSCKIHKAKTQNLWAWADKIEIHSLVKVVWQAITGAPRPPFHTGSPKPGISPAEEPMFYLAKTKTPVLIHNVLAGMCHFFLPTPSHFSGVPISLSAIWQTPKWRREKPAWSVC